jgi:hypothetical protein
VVFETKARLMAEGLGVKNQYWSVLLEVANDVFAKRTS